MAFSTRPAVAAMANRRVRSRLGCRSCKARKIKCDEVRPCCGNCLDRSLVCSLGAGAEAPSQPKIALPPVGTWTAHRQARSSTVLPLYTSLQPSTYPGQVSEARLFELRLLSYYVQRAGDPSVFPSDPQLLPQTILTLALESSHLMDALLAMSANAMRLDQPEDRVLIRASHGYIARSIQKQRRAVGCGLRLRDFEAVYVNCLLIASHTLLQHLFVPLDKDDGRDLQQWFQVFRGLRAITAASAKSFGDSRLATSLPAGRWQDPRTQPAKGSVITSSLSEMLQGGLHALHPGLSLDRYSPVIGYLSLLTQSPTRQSIMRFLFDADPEFMGLLCQGEPTARLLQGVYLAIWGAAKVNPSLDPVAKRDLQLILLLLPAPEAQLLQKVVCTIEGSCQA